MSHVLVKIMNYQKKRLHNHSCGSVQKLDTSTKASSIAKIASNKNTRKKSSSRGKKISIARMKFEDKHPIHIPGTSFSSSLLNESFDVLKLKNKTQTLDDDF